MEIVKELTPELVDKIYKSMKKRAYDRKVSKDETLHHLKQLKAQMGRYKASACLMDKYPIVACMNMIDKKIAKINEG